MSNPDFIQWGFTKKLAKVIEECGEVLAAAGKVQRFGRMAVNPLVGPNKQECNLDWLMRELDDLHEAIHDLQKTVKHGDFDDKPLLDPQFEKDRKVVRATRYPKGFTPGDRAPEDFLHEDFKMGGTD